MLSISFLKETINIQPRDKRLLRLSYANTLTQDDVSDLLQDYNIEEDSIDFSLRLAYLLKRNPQLKFPGKIVPRLEGIIRYYQYKNATLLCAFNAVGKQLNKKKIPILLMKGILLRYFRPNEPRFMWDIDFLVPEENYEEAIQTAVESGFRIKLLEPHSADLVKGAAAIDIHRLYIHDGGHPMNIKKMFAEAEKAVAFDVEVLVPKPEDVMIMMITNAYHNIVVFPQKQKDDFSFLYDCAGFINDKGINWDDLFDIALQTGITHQTNVVLALIDWLLPSLLPADLLTKIPGNKRQDESKIRMDILARNIHKLRYDRCNMKLSQCRTLREGILWFKINTKCMGITILQQNALARKLFVDILYDVFINNKRKNNV
jgi:hypothetical protein